MTRILHTADIHLDSIAEERHAALDSVLEDASNADVDLVTIGGDLFDSELAAEQLRESLRELFSNRSYPILTIPGNHDASAYRSNLFFGDSFIAATESPFDHYVVDDTTRITYLPYTPQATDELLISLRDREPFEGTECLLLHCSLDAPLHGDVGDESEQRYFPVTKEQLAELDFEYYLAGHYHSQHHVELSNGGTFVYPGTPASITQTELGRRTYVYIDTEADTGVQFPSLESYHYDELNLRVTPGQEDRVFREINSQVAIWHDRDVEPQITVDGFIETDETEFESALEDHSNGISVTNRTRDVEHILSHPLFEAFEHQLENRDRLHAIEERDEYNTTRFQNDVWEATLNAFVELAAEGKLR